MPRYFFQIDDGGPPDVDGAELRDLAAAKCEAVKVCGAMVCDMASAFWDTREFKMTVMDDRGLTLLTLEFIGTEAAAISSSRP